MHERATPQPAFGRQMPADLGASSLQREDGEPQVMSGGGTGLPRVPPELPTFPGRVEDGVTGCAGQRSGRVSNL